MNQRGNMPSMIEGALLLLVFLIVMYVIMVVWQPFTSLLFPILNNSESMPYGPIAILLLQILPIIIVIGAIISFFNHIKRGQTIE